MFAVITGGYTHKVEGRTNKTFTIVKVLPYSLAIIIADGSSYALVLPEHYEIEGF